MRLYLWCMCVILWPQNRAMLPMPRGMVRAVCGVRCPDKLAAYRASSVASNIVWGFPAWGSHAPAVSEPLAETTAQNIQDNVVF